MMKLAAHKGKFWGKLAALSSTLALAGVLLSMGVSAENAVPPAPSITKVGGWAWNPSIGWINHQNAIVSKDTKDKIGSFGVTKADDGTLSGWSWSANAGWICWGATCADPAVAVLTGSGGIAPDENTASAKVNADNSVDGWIQLIRYKQYGWISLSKHTTGAGVADGLNYDEAANEFVGWAWGGAKLGWVGFSGRTLYATEYTPDGASAPERACKRGTPTAPGYDPNTDYCAISVDLESTEKQSNWKTHFFGAWLQALGGTVGSIGGFSASAPPPLGQDSVARKKNAEFLVVSGRTGPDSTPQAISQIESACERALADTDPGACKRFGLVSGAARKKTGALSSPFAKKTQVTITRGEETVKRTRYAANGASFDVDALTTPGAPNGYGKQVIALPPGAAGENALRTALASSSNSARTIYFSDGDLTIGKATDITLWRINDGNAPTALGSRTVVVRGDLFIERNLLYENALVPKTVPGMRQMASVAWIVLKKENGTGGSIYFDHCIPPSTSAEGFSHLVAEASGIFFAENELHTGNGKASTCKNDSKYTLEKNRLKKDTDCSADDLTADQKSACARIQALSDPSSDVPLVVHGVLIAKKFFFERVYGGADAPSEKIANDGRAMVSIPPGLDDFLKAFPSL